jgi:hypothetical protein
MSKETKIRNPVNTKINILSAIRSHYLNSIPYNLQREEEYIAYIQAIKSYHRQPCYSYYRYRCTGGFRVCLNKIKY